MDWQEARCYLNGQWQALAEARVPVMDRGFIFGDGVYEVIPVDERAPFRARPHFERLDRGLRAIRIDNPNSIDGWLDLLAQVIERNPWERQSVYVQVTRGVAKRDHSFPAGVKPTVFMVAWPWSPIPAEQIEQGVAAVTHADERWLHCDIKSTSLLGNVLMRQYATDHGAAEAVLLRDGHLTEGSSSNVFVVRGGCLLAPTKNHLILPGITYDAVFEIACARGVAAEVRPITEKELRSAEELWISSSSREVLPVTKLDGKPIGGGMPGPLYRQMLTWFQEAKREDARLWRAELAQRRKAA